MLFPRPFSSRLPSLRQCSVRAAPRTALNPFYRHRYAHSGYGDGDGNPVGESPQKQGASPSADLEHPGPPPVSEGHGSGSGPTKGTSEGHNTGGSSSSSSSASSSSSTGSRSTSTSGSTGGKEARPAIHDERQGPKSSSSGGDDVEAHNREFEGRRADMGGADDGTDRAGKGLWKGQGGADRDP